MNISGQEWPADMDLERIHHRTVAGIHQHQRRQRVRKTAAVAAGAVLALGVTAGTIFVTATDNAVANSTYCYSADSEDSAFVQAVNIDPLSREGAREVCGLAWGNGSLTWGQSHAPVPGLKNYVPDLEVCLRPDNVMGVFPRAEAASTGEEFCTGIGLRYGS